MTKDAGPTLRDVGEDRVLARLFPRLPAADTGLLGPGDDAALVATPDGRLVITTDMMVEGPDFRSAWSRPHDLGWKAAASNLADIAAMGARPTALVVAIAAPPESPLTLLEGIADGLREGCAALAPGCGVVGGDLSASPVLTIAVTAFGDLEGREPVLRSGASPGDIAAVSGELGAAAEALRVLFARAVDDEGRPDAALAEALRDQTRAQLAPTPPIADGRIAAISGASAMIDLSDGLALDADRLARSSGIILDFDSAQLGDDPERALSGGEDHCLLATFPPGVELPGSFRRVGAAVRAGEAGGRAARSAIRLDGVEHPATGWDPYSDDPA